MNTSDKESIKRNIDLIIKKSNSLDDELWNYIDETCLYKVEEALKNIDECIDVCLSNKKSIKKLKELK